MSSRKQRNRRRRIRAARKIDAGPLRMVAEVQITAAAGDDAGPPTFVAVAYTGGPLRVKGYPLPVVIDLAGLKFAASITANLDHDATQRVGHITQPENDGRKVVLSGAISGSGAAAKEVLDNHANGYPWKVSVEADPQGAIEQYPEGKTVEVNGQQHAGPVLVARRATLHGIAFLSRGADENTTVTIAAEADTTRELDMEFADWIKAAGFSPDELTDKQRATLQKQYDAEIKAAAEDERTIGAPAFDIDGLKAAYAKHEAAIESLCFKYQGKVESHKLAEIKAEAMQGAYDLKTEALDKELAPVAFEVRAVKAAAEMEVKLVQAERPTGPAIHASTQDVTGEMIEASFCQTLNLPNIEKHYKPEVLQAAHTHLRAYGLQELLIMGAQHNGYSGRAAITSASLREVLRYAFPPIHAAPSSTMSIPNILSNTANKELLEGFMIEDDPWREIAAIKTVTDFKQVTSYRMLDDMEYEALTPSGEIAHGKLSEESYTRQASTYAKMFSLRREDIINDDLGALDDIRTRLGKGAQLKFQKIFWGTFLDALATFFTTARGNYITGAGSVLDSAGLTAGVLQFRKRTTPETQDDGGTNRAGGRPELLLVPPDLEADADELFVSRNINTGGSSTKAKVPNANTHVNKYRPVISNWLSDTGFNANASTTFWFLLQNPAVMAAICVSYLNGVQTPVIESAEADFNRLGVDFRGYHDFGVDMAEYTAGLMSKGAA